MPTSENLSHTDVVHKTILKFAESISNSIPSVKTYIRDKPEQVRDLEEYARLIEQKEYVPLIIKNERILVDVGRADIEIFGGRIIIEVKVKEAEFDYGHKRLSDYVKSYPNTKYAIITNYESWEYYSVKNGRLEHIDLGLDDIVKTILLEGVKSPLSTEQVKNLFSPISLSSKEFHKIFAEHNIQNDALYLAYKNIINRLYEVPEEEIEDLFVKHTLMQMIVSACLTVALGKRPQPTKACSGEELEIEVVLPYLKWWKTLKPNGLGAHEDKFLDSLTQSIYSKSLLLDWESGKKEDVFRELYEFLIEPETRRKIGEYYTPLWMVEYIVNKVSSIKDKTVLDPFCGSGTFLVIAFYKKVEIGEKPDDAIKEIVGFDINPFAVSIARAELLMAYQNVSGQITTPLVFNVDSASPLFFASKEFFSSFLGELKVIERAIIQYIKFFQAGESDFSELLKIEAILKNYFREVSNASNIEKEIEVRFRELKGKKWSGQLIPEIIKTITGKESVKALAKLIKKYGNGVWAVSVTSLFAPYVIQKRKVDIIFTNPPWAQLTKVKGEYGEVIRKRAKELLRYEKKVGGILNASDISTVLLNACIGTTNERLVFVMPQEAVYTANSHYGLGKILTSRAIKNHRGESLKGKLIQINYDAFGHGELPCIVDLKKEHGEVKCYTMDIELEGEKYSKALHLDKIRCELNEGENYQEYIEKVKEYTKLDSRILKTMLNVREIFPQGDFIRGLFGGQKKKGAKEYAGLVFDTKSYDKTTDEYTIQLYGTKDRVKVPSTFLKNMQKKLIYPSQVYPFYFYGFHDMLLSSKGKEKTERFIREYVLPSVENKEAVETLIRKFKQPSEPKILERDKYYVVYRRIRTFASVGLWDKIPLTPLPRPMRFYVI